MKCLRLNTNLQYASFFYTSHKLSGNVTFFSIILKPVRGETQFCTSNSLEEMH
jgi:hypothetical protein